MKKAKVKTKSVVTAWAIVCDVCAPLQPHFGSGLDSPADVDLYHTRAKARADIGKKDTSYRPRKVRVTVEEL